jgi:hypothetical protein
LALEIPGVAMTGWKRIDTMKVEKASLSDVYMIESRRDLGA